MSSPRKQAVSIAIAWRSGLIGFTRPGLVPAGAIALGLTAGFSSDWE